MAERESDRVRVAIECDGERYHLDEHGQLKIEDVERQAILERAGWRIIRIPYRKWLADPGREIQKVFLIINEIAQHTELARPAAGAVQNSQDAPRLARNEVASEVPKPPSDDATLVSAGPVDQMSISHPQLALLKALHEGKAAEDDLFRRALSLLGQTRLTENRRQSMRAAASDLAARGVIAIEDGEYFMLPNAKTTPFIIGFKADKDGY